MTHKSNSRKNRTDWVTPPEILASLGAFDLDPCCPLTMPWKTADLMLSEPTDGFGHVWSGRVWLNPPYGRAQDRWLAKLSRHGDGVALVPASTETKRFRKYVWGHAAGVCFVAGRIRFYLPDGSRPKNSINQACCLVAYGARNLMALIRSGLGTVVTEVPQDWQTSEQP